jgi:hypothetical protein
MRLFVSYARTDRLKVDSLAQRLRQLGNDAWLDIDLVGGQVWWDNILHQIRESDAFITIVSRSSLKSLACQIERQYAVRLGKPILPLTIEPLSAGMLPSDISRLQIVDYSEPDEDTAYKLIGAIVRLPTPPPLPVPLPEPPDAPSSYLGKIWDQLNVQTLTLDQQFAIVGHLEGALAPTADPAEMPVALDLLRQMEQRADLYSAVERRIALLKQNTRNVAAMRSQSSAGDLLAKLADLRGTDVITAEEFEREKANILASAASQANAADLLAKLADLRIADVITAEEFEREKANIFVLAGPQADASDLLAKLADLRITDVITAEEFEREKAKVRDWQMGEPDEEIQELIAVIVAAAGGDPDAAAQLAPALDEGAEEEAWATIVAVLRRILNGERGHSLLDGLEPMDAAIVTEILTRLS